MSRTKKLLNNAEFMVDLSRPFPVPIAQSNLTQFRVQTVPLTLRELINIRGSVAPARKGVHVTKARRITRNSVGTLQTNAPVGQTGEGFVGDAVKWGRRKAGDLLDYVGDTGIDYASALGKRKLRGVSGKIRGDGFFRNLAGSAVSGLGNLVGNAIKGRGVRKAKKKGGCVKAKRRAVQNGDGFFRDLAGTAVSGLGNFVGNKIKGKGLVAPGMLY